MGRIMPGPNLLLCGAQKAGTTSMHYYLDEHPDIFAVREKEIHFFDNDERYAKGIEWYESRFKNAGNQKYRLESTPIYLYLPKAAERIHEHYPDVKLLFMLRNPVKRAWSHYLMEVRAGRETLSFYDALQAEDKRLKNGEYERKYFSYKDRGLYLTQIKSYLELFPRENIYIMILEDLKKNPADEMKKLFRFLGIDDAIELKRIYKKPKYEGTVPINLKFNYAFKNSPIGKVTFFRKAFNRLFTKRSGIEIPPEAGKFLSDFFAEPNKELSEFLNLQYTLWQKTE